MTYSKYFGPPKPHNPTIKYVAVPPGYTISFLYYELLHRVGPRKIYVIRRWDSRRRLEVFTNPMALRSFYASRRKKRMPITYEMRWELGCRQRWKCKGCKKLLPSAAQVDHVVPLSAGGDDKMDNMQMLCANCHAEKTRKESKQGVTMDRGIPNYFPLQKST